MRNTTLKLTEIVAIADIPEQKHAEVKKALERLQAVKPDYSEMLTGYHYRGQDLKAEQYEGNYAVYGTNIKNPLIVFQ